MPTLIKVFVVKDLPSTQLSQFLRHKSLAVESRKYLEKFEKFPVSESLSIGQIYLRKL